MEKTCKNCETKRVEEEGARHLEGEAPCLQCYEWVEEFIKE